MQNNTSETAPKRERTAIYTLARIIFGFLFHTIFPLRFHNAQILEEMQPPYIIMANHRSFADPHGAGHQGEKVRDPLHRQARAGARR